MLFILGIPAFGQTVNKCVKPNGEIVYQKEPCPDGKGTKIKAETQEPIDYQKHWEAVEANKKRMAEKQADPASAYDAEYEAAKYATAREEVKNGIGKFDKQDVINRLGQPDKINTTKTAYGESQQWVYQKNGKMEFVYFKGNTLSAVQLSD